MGLCALDRTFCQLADARTETMRGRQDANELRPTHRSKAAVSSQKCGDARREIRCGACEASLFTDVPAKYRFPLPRDETAAQPNGEPETERRADSQRANSAG